jgi:hypothetical protein
VQWGVLLSGVLTVLLLYTVVSARGRACDVNHDGGKRGGGKRGGGKRDGGSACMCDG